jgi:NRAMP (natural resistance-associated macrophage protein)-like metal ion transporter
MALDAQPVKPPGGEGNSSSAQGRVVQVTTSRFPLEIRPASRSGAMVAKGRRGVRRWMRTLGPGVITGAADDDPSGISTYAMAGAAAGYSLLWTAVLTAPMMAVVEGMCARIAIVTRKGLTTVLRQRFPRPVVAGLVLIVVVANTANLGADLAGMGAAAALIMPRLPQAIWAPLFCAAILLVETFSSYAAFSRIVKWLCFALFAYVATALVVHVDWGSVLLHAVVPHIEFSPSWIALLLGVLGTTITPYLFFWQSALEVEEQQRAAKRGLAIRPLKDALADATLDVNTGAVYSNVIMFFIIVTTAATLGAHGLTKIATAADAASALTPLAGRFAGALFALGLIGAGLLAVPVLAGSSAYALVEVLGWNEGLDARPSDARGFYGILALGVVLGLAMPTVFHIDPIQALFWCAVGNGIAAVPLLVAITLVANDRGIMGPFGNSLVANMWAWLTIALMGASAIALFITSV